MRKPQSAVDQPPLEPPAPADEVSEPGTDAVGTVSQGQAQPRVFGTHRGLIRISEDFDDELPDEFWFGQGDEEKEKP